MNNQSLKNKCNQTILALAGAAMLAVLPVAAAATSMGPEITSLWNTDYGAAYTGGYNQQIKYDGRVFDPEEAGSFAVSDEIPNHVRLLTISGVFTDTQGTPDATDDTTYGGILLTGTISDQLDYTKEIINFYFEVTGGSAKDLFGGIGGRGMTNITNYYEAGALRNANIDTMAAPVPEPATMTLMFIGGSALVAFRRRRGGATPRA